MFRNSIYLIISILILFPYPLGNIKGYHFSTSYILMLLVFMFLPVAFTKNNYWRSSFTTLIWLMRVVFIIIFLSASFKFGLSSGRIFSFAGYFMISFLYEIPFICNIEKKTFFKIFNTIVLFVLVYASIVIGYFAISQGSLVYSIPNIRKFLPLYPNHFSILLILIYWIRQYFVEKPHRVVDIWIILLVFISLSRAAMATLLISFIINILMSKDANKWKKVASLVLVLMLFIPASIYLMDLKGQSPGSTLERTYHGRTARWEAALEQVKHSPIIGTGFDRTTSVISTYRSISGQQAELGSMHNDYLDLLVKGGIVGLVSFLAVLLGIFVIGLKYNKSLVVLVVTIILTAFFQNPVKNLPIMFCLYFTVGIVLCDVSQGIYIKRQEKIIMGERGENEHYYSSRCTTPVCKSSRCSQGN
jgi:O-antigen ligase